MQISCDNIQSFRGYGPQQILGLYVTDKAYTSALRPIADKYNFKLITPQIVSNSIKKEYSELQQKKHIRWAQDYFVFLPGKVLYDNSRDYLRRVLRSCADGIKRQLKLEPYGMSPYIRGGNYYICDVNGVKKLLISEDKLAVAGQILKTLPQDLKDKLTTPENTLKVAYCVDEICPVPKLDYHIDLFLRPLDNGNVLLADNQVTVESLNKLLSGYKSLINQEGIPETEKEIYQKIVEKIDFSIGKLDITNEYDKYKPQETTNQVAERLKEYGFNPIRVPGNYYYLEPVKSKEREQETLERFEDNIQRVQEYSKTYAPHLLPLINAQIALERIQVENNNTIGVELENFYENNFLNAIVFKDKNDKLVYITGAPLLDREFGITPEIEAKTGLSFRNLFIESIAPYVDRENLHFIGENLTADSFKKTGGPHCAVAEIPAQ